LAGSSASEPPKYARERKAAGMIFFCFDYILPVPRVQRSMQGCLSNPTLGSVVLSSQLTRSTLEEPFPPIRAMLSIGYIPLGSLRFFLYGASLVALEVKVCDPRIHLRQGFLAKANNARTDPSCVGRSVLAKVSRAAVLVAFRFTAAFLAECLFKADPLLSKFARQRSTAGAPALCSSARVTHTHQLRAGSANSDAHTGRSLRNAPDPQTPGRRNESALSKGGGQWVAHCGEAAPPGGARPVPSRLWRIGDWRTGSRAEWARTGNGRAGWSLELQVGLTWRDAAGGTCFRWLFANRTARERSGKEQEASLVSGTTKGRRTRRAAAAVAAEHNSTAASGAENPALQPAASDLSYARGRRE